MPLNYWMDDKAQFFIYTLISLSQADIEELVVPGKRKNIPHHQCLQMEYSKHGMESFCSKIIGTMT
jgi:hypothetical protein